MQLNQNIIVQTFAQTVAEKLKNTRDINNSVGENLYLITQVSTYGDKQTCYETI